MTDRLEYRSAAGTRLELLGDVTDVDSKSHRVRIEFPHERVDAHGTTFAPGCWSESFRRRLPAFVWQHRQHEPLGFCVSAQDLPDRAEVVNQFSDLDAVPRARQAFTQIEDGAVRDASFGFKDGRTRRHPQHRGVIQYTAGTMIETSPVTRGSIPDARATGLRSLPFSGIEVAGAIAQLDRIGARAAARASRQEWVQELELEQRLELSHERRLAVGRLDRRLIEEANRR